MPSIDNIMLGIQTEGLFTIIWSVCHLSYSCRLLIRVINKKQRTQRITSIKGLLQSLWRHCVVTSVSSLVTFDFRNNLASLLSYRPILILTFCVLLFYFIAMRRFRSDIRASSWIDQFPSLVSINGRSALTTIYWKVRTSAICLLLNRQTAFSIRFEWYILFRASLSSVYTSCCRSPSRFGTRLAVINYQYYPTWRN